MITFNKKKIAFIVDTSSDILPNEFDDVFVIPLIINVTDKQNIQTSYKDVYELDSNKIKTFFENGYLIKTSQASLSDMIQTVAGIEDQYDEIWVLPIHTKLSGNFNSWKILCDDFNKLRILKTEDVSYGIRDKINFIKSELTKKDISFEEMEKYIIKNNYNNVGFLIVDDMQQLIKGGRVSNFKGAIGKLLKIKPIIKFDNTGLNFIKNIKTYKNYIDFVFDQVHKTNRKILKTIIYTSFNSNDKKMKEFLSLFSSYNKEEIYQTTPLPSVIVAHVGIKYFAIYFVLE